MSRQAKPAQCITLGTAIAAMVCITFAGACASEKNDETVERSAKQVEQERAATGEPVSPPPEPASPPVTTVRDDQSYDPTVLTSTAIEVDTELASLCVLEDSDAFFTFDAAQVLPEARDRLQTLATCATIGPAKGKELVVVDRADVVGPDEYNEVLGMSRAESVASQLRQFGVEKTRVERESRGEAPASEDRPGAWPYHRRVTLRLKE